MADIERKRELIMLTCDYRVVRIDGDYAGLRKIGEAESDSGELNFVARALLPENITEGCRLHYEMLVYTLAEE